MTINIDRALATEGHMEPAELRWLAEQASQCQRVVEIGCWMGRSTRALGDHCPGVVFAVDHWRGSPEQQERLKDKGCDWLFRQFCTNLRDLINTAKVVPVRASSLQAANGLFAGMAPMDLVFIDGSHDYESVWTDITAWLPLVKVGGMICGHDGGFPPVEMAWKELVPHACIQAQAIWGWRKE